MIHSFSPLRSRRILLLAAGLWALLFWTFRQAAVGRRPDLRAYETSFPLAWKHLHSFNGTGGAWYIPETWIDDVAEPAQQQQQPRTIVEAARLAAQAAAKKPARQMDHARIPLLVHQTWATARIDAWSPMALHCVERWLAYAVGGAEDRRPGHGGDDNGNGNDPSMAYFFWDDEGVLAFVNEYEPAFAEAFVAYFTPVERADIFRILVCKWFGGIYGDIDTEPLQHPAHWIHLADLATWRDPETKASYGRETDDPPRDEEEAWSAPGENERPVRLLAGLEADVDPASDAYWRMGYTYPVQLTQWAIAAAPQHPVLEQFMDHVRAEVDKIDKVAAAADGTATDDHNDHSDHSDAVVAAQVHHADPLTRTGPAAITMAVSTYLETNNGLRWNAVTGCKDGGKAKIVGDVLVFPITGFSPGRGTYGNMGSKPVTDPDARLQHHAQGSWRKFDPKVELGKLCRSVLGLCKDWSKVPA
ncbi:glycosyltransferase family 32 protein [Niveomyces insectorum RCEF 264]|uniref:Glycosyltransferase family 32 protein n=1 Tax=Niveomyces insectorum RCEF 264 TaxID=1081102 RepID=A0A167VM45_9HYPO|nr:glycosyltransferase family 32 protein [Niveomyces insectorum RCEF 264]